MFDTYSREPWFSRMSAKRLREMGRSWFAAYERAADDSYECLVMQYNIACLARHLNARMIVRKTVRA